MSARLVVTWTDGALSHPLPDRPTEGWLCRTVRGLLGAMAPERAARPAVWEVHHPPADSAVPSPVTTDGGH